jgi:hypothetical protein
LRQPLRRRPGHRPPAIGRDLHRATARLLLGVAIGLLLAASPAARADDVSALYQASWAGLPAAHISLSLREAPGAYRNEIAIGSEGLPHLVTKFRGTAVAEGKEVGQTTIPARYDATYDLRKRKDRQLRMIFASSAGAVIAERGPGDTSRKPELAEQFRRNVVDPLSVITAIRTTIRRGETAFTIPVYDGARRFDVVVRVLPRDPKDPGVHLAMSLHPIAGFKGETSDDGDPDNAPRPVSLTLSDDARLMPLKMSVPIFFLPLDVTFERLCPADVNCAW